jgi:putative ABC transport system permease protein
MRELRLAFRHLVRRPGFSIVAILTLALGIGANAAVFSVSHAVLLSPLPYERPGQIVILNESTPQFPQGSVTRYNYDDWRARAKSFSGMGAFRPLNVTVTGAGDPERVPAKMITANLLPLLGVHIQHGRNFTAPEDQPGADNVAIVGAAYAARRFAGLDAVGQVVHLDNKPYTIVGVMPPHFELFQPADIYVPFGPWVATLPEDRGWHPGIFPIARLKDGVSLEDARVEMDAICQALETELPESNLDVRALVTRAQDLVVQNVRPALLLLTLAVAVVLLIACANVANLLLARAVDRQKELAVRVALGASRWRIVRQLMVESLLLGAIGGAAGLFVAMWAVSLLTATAVTGLPRAQNISVNWNVALFALALSVVTGLIFGIAPALQAVQQPIRRSLNDEARGSTGSARTRSFKSALVVIETALALVLLVAAGLLLRSFSTLTRVDPGFPTDNLLIVNLPLSPQKYQNPVLRNATVERVVEGVRALPGVKGAGITTALPMAGAGATIHFNRAAYPPKGPDDYVMAGLRAATPGYLSVLGVPLKRGRLFSESDRAGAPLVVVINESMARQFFPGRDALGERMQLGTTPDPESPTMEIVGIVGDTKQSFESAAKAEMFVPYAQFSIPILTGLYLNTALVVRTAKEAGALTASVRGVIEEIDPSQPLVNARTMETAMAGTVAQPRLQMTLLLVFAGVALALAALGVYGVMAYTVSQRVPEIGVRMAIGASPPQIVRLVVREGATLALLGIGVGMAGAGIAGWAMRGLLFNIKAHDPLTFVAAPVLLALAALAACYLPARRAAQISPVTALGTR